MAMATKPSEEECAKAAKVADALVRECFPNMKIARVMVGADFGSDGEPVLSIRIVIDIPKDSHIDFDAHVRFVDNLQLRMQESGIYAFPVPYFALLSEMENAA